MRYDPPIIVGERCVLFSMYGIELVGTDIPTFDHLGVTALGKKERANREQLLDTVEPDSQKVFKTVLRMLSPSDRDPPECAVKHFIFVDPSFVPAKRQAYLLGEEKLYVIRSQVKELVKKGWIVLSCSPWAAPILFVAKDGRKALHMCIDFRNLNALTKKDCFLLLRLEPMLHRARKREDLFEDQFGFWLLPDCR